MNRKEAMDRWSDRIWSGHDIASLLILHLDTDTRRPKRNKDRGEKYFLENVAEYHFVERFLRQVEWLDKFKFYTVKMFILSSQLHLVSYILFLITDDIRNRLLEVGKDCTQDFFRWSTRRTLSFGQMDRVSRRRSIVVVV